MIFMLIFLSWIRRNITGPIVTLEGSVTEFASRSHGQHDVYALYYKEPEIKPNNEVRRLSGAVNRMAIDMKDYVKDVLTAEKRTEEFKKRLADTSDVRDNMPWEKISAAIGVDFYNGGDDTVLEVFRRADQKMYAAKKEMKAERKD